MKELYILCPADMRKPPRWIELDPDDFSTGIHHWIDCSFFEHVYIGNDMLLIVDDNGKMVDPPKPINLRASQFYPGTKFGDPIVGDVIFAMQGIRNGEHDIVPVPELFAELLKYSIGEIDDPEGLCISRSDQDGTDPLG